MLARLWHDGSDRRNGCKNGPLNVANGVSSSGFVPPMFTLGGSLIWVQSKATGWKVRFDDQNGRSTESDCQTSKFSSRTDERQDGLGRKLLPAAIQVGLALCEPDEGTLHLIVILSSLPDGAQAAGCLRLSNISPSSVHVLLRGLGCVCF